MEMQPTKIYKGEVTFDCLKMKEEIQAKIYEEIKNMTPEERVAYFNIPPEESIFSWVRNAKK
jgi:hypothetical protein